MSTIRVDPDKEKMKYLLTRLEQGLLDKEGATELREVLIRKKRQKSNKNDAILKKDLSDLVELLDRYIAGKVNLYRPINSKISGV
jgi:hypothetical protein